MRNLCDRPCERCCFQGGRVIWLIDSTVKDHSDYIAIGALGMTGVTAWVGAFKAFQVKPEHTVCVSGAAG